ncbi:MAG: S8 family serine peptidase [Bacteroidota bacterium]
MNTNYIQRTIISIVFALLTAGLFGQTPFYYYKGHKIYLTENTEKALIKFRKDADKSEVRRLLDAGNNFIERRDVDDETEYSEYMVLEARSDLEQRITLSQFLSNEGVLSASPMLQYNNGGDFAITDEFTVKLKPSTSYARLQDLINTHQCSVVEENEFVKNQFLISVPKTSSLDAMELANLFYETSLFEFSEPNFLALNAFQSRDPYFVNQWSLKNTGKFDCDIRIEPAWNITEGSPKIRIAVVDNGIDLRHPDLIANLDPGYDATGKGSKGAANPKDFHGTACAGIIGAIKDNNIGIAGVAPQCRIIPVRIGSLGISPAETIAKGIRWANKKNADIISLSVNLPVPVQAVEDAIHDAVLNGRKGLGCVVVASSYNEDRRGVFFPASLDNVVAVGASTATDHRLTTSCYGSALDLVAPGEYIVTTDNVGNTGQAMQDYAYFTGTSASCPHVAGVAGLVLSVNPCLTSAQVKEILELSCDKVGGYCYNTASGHPHGTWNEEMGHGRLNAYSAVRLARSTSTNHYADVNNAIDNATSELIDLKIVPIPDVNPTPHKKACSIMAEGTYSAFRHEIIKDVTFPYTPAATIIGTSNGLSPASPNDGRPWMEAINVTETSATLRSYVFEIHLEGGGPTIRFWPTSPANVKFDYTLFSDVEKKVSLQNETVTAGNKTHAAIDIICTGNNVTSNKPQGNYSVEEDANVILQAGRKVILGPGTNVNPGSKGYFKASVTPFPIFICNQFPQDLTVSSNNRGAVDPKAMKDQANYLHDYEATFLKAEEQQDKRPKVYPMPFQDLLTLEYTIEKSEHVAISICDATGRELIQLKNNATHERGTYRIELKGIALPSGVYLLKFIADNKSYAQKIVKE